MGQQRRTVALAAWAVLANLACGSITEGGGKPPLWKKGLRFCRAGNCHSTQTLAGRRHSTGANLSLPGGFIHHDASLVRELRHRSGLAWKAYSTCKNKVFLAYHGMAFFMLRPDRPPEEAMHRRGVRALAILNLPSIATLLHVARLRHLLCGIRTRVLQRWSHVDGGASFGCWEQAWDVWAVTCQEHPTWWKSIVRRAQSQALGQECWEIACRYDAGLVYSQLKCAGADLPDHLVEPSPTAHFCARCGLIFKSYRAWSMHAFKTRGRTTECRQA